MSQVVDTYKIGKWEIDELHILKKYYGKLTTQEISDILNRSRNAVQIKARRMGLKYEDKYFYNKSYFNKIDTPEKAYWLGFIYADGNVFYDSNKRQYTLSIKLKESDKGHLKKFNKSIGGNIEVKTFLRRGNFPDKRYNGKLYGSCSIRVYSKEMADDLIDKGVYPNKTYRNINMPPWLNDQFTWHFIRGFLDGDGHITVPSNNKKYGYRIGFTCNCKAFLMQLKYFMSKFNVSSNIYKSRNTYRLEIKKVDSLVSFMKYCYNNPSVYLDRKYEKYKQLKSLLS